MKKALRTAQVFFPLLADIKPAFYRRLMRITRQPSESTYKIFARFPFPAGSQFLDIGANHGQTLDSFRLFQKQSPVVSFEPNPLLAGKLSKRFDTDPLVEIVACGLGEEDGEFTLHVPVYRGYVFDGLASFDRRAAENWLSHETIYGFDPAKLELRDVKCAVKRWDSFDTRPALVKIDVQGFEMHVLRGGGGTIERCRPIFIIENDADMLHWRFLENIGYRQIGYEKDALLLDKTSFRNTLYAPMEKVSDLSALF